MRPSPHLLGYRGTLKVGLNPEASGLPKVEFNSQDKQHQRQSQLLHVTGRKRYGGLGHMPRAPQCYQELPQKPRSLPVATTHSASVPGAQGRGPHTQGPLLLLLALNLTAPQAVRL